MITLCASFPLRPFTSSRSSSTVGSSVVWSSQLRSYTPERYCCVTGRSLPRQVTNELEMWVLSVRRIQSSQIHNYGVRTLSRSVPPLPSSPLVVGLLWDVVNLTSTFLFLRVGTPLVSFPLREPEGV